ncbi:MAG: hypothetical protein AAF570_28165, partial [Bacteroidota bacterium]
LRMNIWRALALFKTFRFGEALNALDEFAQEAQKFDGVHQAAFLFNYYNLRLNVLKCLGDLDAAGNVLQEALDASAISEKPLQRCMLLRSLADHQFIMGQYAGACATIRDLKDEQGFDLLNDENKMFLEIFELVNHYEAGKHEFITENYKPVRKRYRKTLRQNGHSRTQRFLELIHRMNDAEVEGRRVSINAAYKNFKLYFDGEEHGEDQIIQFDLYLRSKVEKKKYYELFLEQMQDRK